MSASRRLWAKKRKKSGGIRQKRLFIFVLLPAKQHKYTQELSRQMAIYTFFKKRQLKTHTKRNIKERKKDP